MWIIPCFEKSSLSHQEHRTWESIGSFWDRGKKEGVWWALLRLIFAPSLWETRDNTPPSETLAGSELWPVRALTGLRDQEIPPPWGRYPSWGWHSARFGHHPRRETLPTRYDFWKRQDVQGPLQLNCNWTDNPKPAAEPLKTCVWRRADKQ